MLRIRLRRRGKNKFATYRLVLAEHSAPVKGRFIEDLGFYNPHTKELNLHKEELTTWMAKGAQPSATVHNLLVNNKFIDAPKVTSWKPKKKPEADKKS